MNTLNRHKIARATTFSPWTTNFQHLLSFPRIWRKRATRQDLELKAVRPSDRIKYWNIVPGDQIRLLGDKTKTLHEVMSINRFSNRVFVKGLASETDDGRVRGNKNYHYSRCQLFLGNYEFPAEPGSTQPQTVPVYAKRLGTSPPFWNPFLQRFDWQRFATKTDPPIPYMAREERILIPWPQPAKARIPEPTSYDTSHDILAQVTYTPPKFSPSISGPLPSISEDAFLASIVNPDLRETFDDSLPVEQFMHKELANPHSKAKKLKRYKEYKIRTHKLLKDMVAAELKDLRGRKPREARAEAMHKWRAQLKVEREERKKMRWKHRAEMANLARKASRKARKEMQQRRRLTEMMLEDGANQVIPKDI